MALLNLVLPARSRAMIVQIADQVACASTDAVCQRVQQRVLGMSPAEARGYVRARSAEVLVRKAEYALAHRHPRIVARRDEIIACAREEVVRRVMARVRQPSTPISLRRAA